MSPPDIKNTSSWLPGLIGPLEIQADGEAQAKRMAINLIGATVEDSPAYDRIDVDISGGSLPALSWGPSGSGLPIGVDVATSGITTGAVSSTPAIDFGTAPEFPAGCVAKVQAAVAAGNSAAVGEWLALDIAREFRVSGGSSTPGGATAEDHATRVGLSTAALADLTWDNVTNRPKITFTGQAGKTLEWSATISTTVHPVSGTSPPPPSFSMSTENLSLWLESDDATGTNATISWISKASAGISAGKTFVDGPGGFGSQVVNPGTAYDGHDSVEWPAAQPYPRLDTSGASNYWRTVFLGQAANAEASYTIALVVQPLGVVNSGGSPLTGGKFNAQGAPMIGVEAYQKVCLMDDAGTAKVGVYHESADAGGTLLTQDGTTAITWPGGFGTWGLMFVSYDYATSTISIRINGTTVYSAAINNCYGPVAGADTLPLMGGGGGGASSPKFRCGAVAVWPAQALTVTQMQTVEAQYFGPRFPSLGL